MRYITLSIFILIWGLALNFDAKAQVPEWYQKIITIEPWISSREDFEKSFTGLKVVRSFVYENRETVFYTNEDGRFEVRYSTGRCEDRRNFTCSLEKDIVVDLLFFPRNRIKMSKFKTQKK